jgi:hypothetical protein
MMPHTVPNRPDERGRRTDRGQERQQVLELGRLADLGPRQRALDVLDAVHLLVHRPGLGRLPLLDLRQLDVTGPEHRRQRAVLEPLGDLAKMSSSRLLSQNLSRNVIDCDCAWLIATSL